MKRPRCERKGTVPHPATYGLTWDLLSGRVTKFFCADHAKTARPQPDHISELIDYVEEAITATEEE
jgi:hypothetical protein